VGSAYEKPGRTGFAHLFEHIMFEGSANVPEGDIDNLLEAVGGAPNGSTTTDRTNYLETVSSNALELALWIEADRMGWLLDTMTQEKLDIQRDVVKNERRQSYDNRPYGKAFETISANLYPAEHPYHWPVIGYMEDLSAATLEDVSDFFRTYYAPNNASLAVAGDVRVSEVRELAAKYFGDIPAGPAVPEVEVPDPTLSSNSYVVLEDDVQLARLYMAWHSPEAFSQGDAAMDVVGSVLAEGKSSRLHRRLVLEEQVAQDVSAFQSPAEIGSSFVVMITAKPDGSLEGLERAVREEISKLAATGVIGVEMERSINQIETGFVRALERVGGFSGKAERLNEYYFLTGNPGFVRRDFARYGRVTGESVREHARSYLEAAHGVVLSVVPRGRTELAVPETELAVPGEGGNG
jgi:zinc protease